MSDLEVMLCSGCGTADALRNRIAELEAENENLACVLDEAQDVICSGVGLDKIDHAEFMRRINTALSPSPQPTKETPE